jgi:hypothetical protein
MEEEAVLAIINNSMRMAVGIIQKKNINSQI